MASRTSTAPTRSNHRRVLISLGSAVVLTLLAAGGWWGVRSAASSTAPDAGPVAPALPDSTRMGPVELVTNDLEPMRSFYVDAVGLKVLAESADQLTLGSGDEEVLVLTEANGRDAGGPVGAGLYHSAILYPNEQSLATVVQDVARLAPESYSGSADHAVSLAFYFSDPDGNGVELYVDTPKDEWVWEDGLVQMGSAPLDPNAFIRQHLGAAAKSTATMGHVHLRVGDLDRARAFYADTLGFAVTARVEGALFYAAGGYHHHVATNTWGSAGAGVRGESLGLGSLTVRLGSGDALLAAANRLKDAGATFEQAAGVITVDDPWGNTVRLLAK